MVIPNDPLVLRGFKITASLTANLNLGLGDATRPISSEPSDSLT